MTQVFYKGLLTDNILLVQMTHYQPHLLSESDLEQGYILEFDGDEPVPPRAPLGKTHVKKLNVKTGELFFEEVDLPESSQSKAVKHQMISMAETVQSLEKELLDAKSRSEFLEQQLFALENILLGGK